MSWRHETTEQKKLLMPNSMLRITNP